MEIFLTGLGTKAGSEIIGIRDIAEKFGKGKKSIERCGTNQLHRIGDGESLEELANYSAATSLDNVGITANQLRGIYASICCPTTRYSMPGLARIVGDNLGAKEIPMITLSMGCTGGVHAIQTAYNQLKVDSLNGKKGTSLVVVGDHISRALDEESWDTSGVFSDGVASIVLSTEVQGDYVVKAVESANLEGDAGSMNVLNVSRETKDEKATFRMDGPKVFSFASKKTYPAILRLLGLTKLPEDCYFVPHQASGVILKHMQERNGLRQDQIYTDGIGKFGNMTGASILFGLKDALERELVGDRDVILGAFGAELAVGAVYLVKN